MASHCSETIELKYRKLESKLPSGLNFKLAVLGASDHAFNLAVTAKRSMWRLVLLIIAKRATKRIEKCREWI